ncbi:hypothetical protein RD792_004247 [Penstemon davidsonii]|uniref:Uncharacterized protein n=1 Tax=Penstemon davidsonii TaxID=160366 RepID=A0ABR0DIA0_9LAMI|nr:hypothetical protein RD792_004247 [Penstemon davidsonii]
MGFTYHKYRDIASGTGRCLKLSMTDGVQRVVGFEHEPIEDLEVLAPAGLKVVISNVKIEDGHLFLVPGALEVLGGSVKNLDAARKRRIQKLYKLGTSVGYCMENATLQGKGRRGQGEYWRGRTKGRKSPKKFTQMNHLSLFSCGLEVADLLLTSGLLHSSWDAILDTQKQFHPFDTSTTLLPSVKCKVHDYPPNGSIIAFVSSPQSTVHHFQTQGRDLISSQELKVAFNLFDFIGTKVNPFFSIKKTAVLVFSSILDELTLLRNQRNVTIGSSTSINIAYRPFGTYFPCSELGCACFEEPDSILELLVTSMGSNFALHQPNSLQITDYGMILEHLVRRSICRGVSLVDNSITNLQAGIVMHLKAIGVETQGNGGGLNSLTTTTAERARKTLTQKNSIFDPNEKLTNRKIDLTYLEWYKKLSEDQGGYYDNYKNKQQGTRERIKRREQIIKRQQYWKRMVTKVEQMPQKGANFRLRWLYAGTHYRRMVEPLDIADYYKKGLKDYIAHGRSQHYVMLEKWLNEGKPVEGAKVRNYACSLTEDSCFWAHVEEAILSCRSMGLDMQLSREKLIVFEYYVMNLIRNFAVSPEIFLPKSSFMQWWEEYNVIVGSSYESALCDFMRNHYRSYA